MEFSICIAKAYPLLSHRPRLGAVFSSKAAENLKRETLMLANDKERPLSIQFAEEVPRTEIAVGNPEVILSGCLQYRVKQRAFLGMAIFTQDDIGHQAIGRFIDD